LRRQFQPEPFRENQRGESKPLLLSRSTQRPRI
jgi:hypothetical protein